ncbi:hypothetical protein M427DRAFT_27898 [Gonapodya prolifera JEL478]|uniref:Glycosyltransferase 2-like domain-containing protein n=1 Tax=Gonapodya prolifera (strain JEL478) TaxID=1344416 RepID=A0A139AVP9_GONPJ|nr:hypothetical protein M427DRAFT_27898 [Gonapodya prolifera JEL478]|eukprot:KXS20806.1 hypothetical protein M427DRAFT_27898 [Gonapodya prolifera JEL478]
MDSGQLMTQKLGLTISAPVTHPRHPTAPTPTLPPLLALPQTPLFTTAPHMHHPEIHIHTTTSHYLFPAAMPSPHPQPSSTSPPSSPVSPSQPDFLVLSPKLTPQLSRLSLNLPPVDRSISHSPSPVTRRPAVPHPNSSSLPSPQLHTSSSSSALAPSPSTQALINLAHSASAAAMASHPHPPQSPLTSHAQPPHSPLDVQSPPSPTTHPNSPLHTFAIAPPSPTASPEPRLSHSSSALLLSPRLSVSTAVSYSSEGDFALDHSSSRPDAPGGGNGGTNEGSFLPPPALLSPPSPTSDSASYHGAHLHGHPSPHRSSPNARPRDMHDFLLLLVSLGSVALVFAGPKLFPRVYVAFMLGFFCLFISISATHVFKWYRTAWLVMRTVAKGTDDERLMQSSPGAYTHIFVMPNYCEPIELLRKTISRLSQHHLAPTNYILLLAMEASESGHAVKSARLVDEFRGCFKEVVVTAHPQGVRGEQRGKASNVNWAVRSLARYLRARYGHHSLKQYVVTVTDADAQIPELYVHHLELALSTADDPYALVYAPPMFFSRNCADVPGAVRITDALWSCMVAQNLGNWRGIAFPCAIYSLSLLLADRINYWDTSPDGIAEDFHTMLRAFLRTDGRARCQLIPVPINLTNVQATTERSVRGYVSNMRARFSQAVRHMYGGCDVGYAIREMQALTGGPFATLWRLVTRRERAIDAADKVLLMFHVLEAHILGNCTGWLMMLWLPVWEAFGGVGKLIGDDEVVWVRLVLATQILSACATVPTFLNLFLYEHYHRVVDRKLYGRERSTRTLWNLTDYAWAPISAVLYMTLPATIASIRRVWEHGGEAAYIVGEKVVAETGGARDDVPIVDAVSVVVVQGAAPTADDATAADVEAVLGYAVGNHRDVDGPLKEGTLVDIMSDTPPVDGVGVVAAEPRKSEAPSRSSISGLLNQILHPAATRIPALIKKVEVDAGWEGVVPAAWSMASHKVEEKSA